MSNKTFVKVIDTEDRLYYRVCYTDYQGHLWDALNPEEYPWIWGFEKIENALKIARNANADYETGVTCRDLASQLATKERNQ